MQNSNSFNCFFFTAVQSPYFKKFGYIGLRDFAGNNTDWRWIADSTPLNFSNWEPGQPELSSQLCVVAILPFNPEGETGRWHDASCDDKFHAICETDRVSWDN